MKLLLAEDDEFSRDMLVRRLERQGFEMIAAADGREALLAARQHRPDLIIMDLDMPIPVSYTHLAAMPPREPNSRSAASSGAG